MDPRTLGGCPSASRLSRGCTPREVADDKATSQIPSEIFLQSQFPAYPHSLQVSDVISAYFRLDACRSSPNRLESAVPTDFLACRTFNSVRRTAGRAAPASRILHRGENHYAITACNDGRLAGVVLTVAAIAVPGRANDHRDGPRIAQNTPTLGNIDINDVFIFRAPHNADRTAMIMTLSAAAGVVGPAQFHPGAAYEFRVDNTGDAVSDVVFQVVFSPPNAQGQQTYSVRLMAVSPHPHDAIIGARQDRYRLGPEPPGLRSYPAVAWSRPACSATRSSKT